MTEQEGAIRFRLEFTPAPPLPMEILRPLNAWRKVLHLTRLIGQDPQRYEGYGYGNISMRLEPADPAAKCRFAITGTQTGHLADLTNEHYATVLDCFLRKNLAIAEGPIRPSSESLTHGAVYELNPTTRCALHAHAPDIWEHAEELRIPITRPDATYGTPELALDVQRVIRECDLRTHGILVMGGHRDGVVAFGRTPEQAGCLVLKYLARAWQV